MKILFLCSEYPPQRHRGGIGSYVVTMSRLMARSGHEAHVLGCAPKATAMDTEEDGVFVHRRPQFRLPGLSLGLGNDALASRLRASLSSGWHARHLGFVPDVIEAPEWMAESLALKGPPPLVVQLHGPLHLIQEFNGISLSVADRAAVAMERRCVRHADLVVSPTHALVARLRASGWIGRTPIAVSPPPVLFHDWGPVQYDDGAQQIVLCVTKLQPLKGVRELILASARLNGTAASHRLRIIGGSGSETAFAAELRALVATTNAPVEFVGELSAADLNAAYRCASIVVVPSRFESYSLVALEAMACGIPVIVTAETGAAEIVQAADGGLVVASSHVDDLAAALRELLQNVSRARAHGQAGRVYVERHLELEVVAERRLELYGAAIKHARTRR